jgi:uncharacterized spore protein YtfJ
MDLHELLQQARSTFSAGVVVGEPVERDGVTVVPAVAITGGGGGGTGQGDAEGAGAGFGLSARPVGAWVIRGERVEWRPAVDVTRIALAALAVLALALLRLRR